MPVCVESKLHTESMWKPISSDLELKSGLFRQNVHQQDLNPWASDHVIMEHATPNGLVGDMY
jgi:hypothetical protein